MHSSARSILCVQIPAQLLQDDEGSHMCDTWASTQGPHAAAGPREEPRSEDKELHLILPTLYWIVSFPFLADYLKKLIVAKTSNALCYTKKEREDCALDWRYSVPLCRSGHSQKWNPLLHMSSQAVLWSSCAHTQTYTAKTANMMCIQTHKQFAHPQTSPLFQGNSYLFWLASGTQTELLTHSL